MLVPAEMLAACRPVYRCQTLAETPRHDGLPVHADASRMGRTDADAVPRGGGTLHLGGACVRVWRRGADRRTPHAVVPGLWVSADHRVPRLKGSRADGGANMTKGPRPPEAMRLPVCHVVSVASARRR